MTHPAHALLNALEAIDLSSAQGALDHLTVLLVERQQLLDQLQKTDVSLLEEAVRAQLRTRMQGILDRDQRTLSELQAALEDTRKGLEKAAQARVASRGYAATSRLASGRPLSPG